MYKVLISRTAEKQLKKIPLQTQRRIAGMILSFEVEPRPFGCKKMAGTSNTYRVRVVDYRIIYDILDQEVIVTVLKIGHRRDVYR